MSPIFLSRWNLASRPSLQSLNAAYLDATDHPSPASLDTLKEAYLRTFPDLEPEGRERMKAASTVRDIASLFDASLSGGLRVRFKVRTFFKHGEDDDDEDDDDYLEVSTPFGDCGIDFQVGETYLVYADNEESSGVLSTTVCARTRRLTDAGEDLAYLTFYKGRREESTRLEGFTTTDYSYQLDLDKMHDPTTMRSPVPGVVLELRSERLLRYATSDGKGRFVFDGLVGGEYSLSAFHRGYPANGSLLGGPQALSIESKSCALAVLVLPKDGAR